MEVFKNIVNFFFELGTLKRIPRSGWRNIGIKNPDSVAGHAFATAQIAYILGKIEKVNAERAALIALFHDNGEARIGDHNLIAQIYLETGQAEKTAFLDQIRTLPESEAIKEFYNEWEAQKTPESIVAKDADRLELAVQAKCYLDSGNKLVELWIKSVKRELKTESAKKLFDLIGQTKMDEWWKEIPEIQERIKTLEEQT